MKLWQKITISFLGILLSIFLYNSHNIKISFLDTPTNTYFSQAITKAGFSYATCRAINAGISVIKDSNIQLEPAGIGLSLSVGQFLDPLDDMIERLSDILVTAIVSLGVQKIIYEIGILIAPIIFSIFLVIFSVLIWFENKKIYNINKIIIKILFIILVIRFFLPLSALANNYINRYYFEKKIAEVKEKMTFHSSDFDKLKKFSIPKGKGILGSLKNSGAFVKQKAIEVKNAFLSALKNAGNLIKNLLELAKLYIAFFIIQVVLLPLFSFWLLMKLLNTFFSTKLSTVLHIHRQEVNGVGADSKS